MTNFTTNDILTHILDSIKQCVSLSANIKNEMKNNDIKGCVFPVGYFTSITSNNQQFVDEVIQPGPYYSPNNEPIEITLLVLNEDYRSYWLPILGGMIIGGMFFTSGTMITVTNGATSIALSNVNNFSSNDLVNSTDNDNIIIKGSAYNL
jgi:hypothetical protein